jgi:5-methylcytosine-specific restriction endonuclease McrA
MEEPRQRLPQRFLFCLGCASPEVCARGLCRSCYDAAYHDGNYFAGVKANVLARDGHCCRGCGAATNVVHHRRPGCDQEEWLVTLCPACHATVERLERPNRYLPPFLLTLWREQHPEAEEQLAFDPEQRFF